jgi:hypothetical protein
VVAKSGGEWVVRGQQIPAIYPCSVKIPKCFDLQKVFWLKNNIEVET